MSENISKQSRLKIIDVHSSEEPKIDYLLNDFMPRKGIGVLIGESRVGKTFLALRLTKCLATGEKLADFKSGLNPLSENAGISPLNQLF